MQKICIDARLYGIKDTGPGRYTENLIANLPDDPNYKIVLIVSPDTYSDPKLAKFDKFVAHLHPYSILSQQEMLMLMWKIKPDLLHSTHFTIPVFWHGKIVVTIHDLIKHYSRGSNTTTRDPLFYWLKYFGYLYVVWMAVHRSSHIITPSQYWKDELVRRYHIPESKVSVTYEGVSNAFLQNPLPTRNIIPARPYVIYTGNLYPHKNVPILIDAINRLSGKVILVIVCARSVFENYLPPSPHVKYLGRVSDDDLINLYQKSMAFIFPSLIEGFGLPGLEAMACGTPVIAATKSNRS
ncbi:MAG: Glycosyltransferase [Microgenomates group bacterium Gr01-1014_16]|nr:MAG: Glycosyltransferase [Microgenomates group bacterium Gr01-1014_16]